MFYNAQYNQYVQEGTQFNLGDVTYPPQWLNQSTPEQKAEAGLVEVVVTNQPANQVYYWVSETLNGPELTYVNTPKDLVGVKTTAVNQVNSTAYSILFPTDWMVVKAYETSTAIPANWNSWRQSIRNTATTTVNAVEGAADVDAVEAVMSNIAWPKDPDQVLAEAAQQPTEGA